MCVCIRDTHHPLWTSSNDDCSPHHCVGFLFFAWIPPGQPPPPPPPPPLHLHSSLTHHSLTHSCTHALTHSRTHSLTQTLCLRVASWLPFFRRSTQSLLEELRLPFVWQAQFTEPPRGGVARVGAAGPRLPFVWQAQYEPPGRAAARVAAAGPRLPFVWQAQYTEPSWTSRGARGRRWAAAAGCLSCGRRSTQSLQEELGRAWPPLGRGCLLCGRRSTQSLQEELASWTSCGARGRAAGPRLPFAWQAQYAEHPHHLWHTIFLTQICLTPSFRHHPWHTNFDTPSFTPLCPTPSFTHNFVTHHLAQTTLSHTIFHTPLCHTPSFTFSHTIFHTPSFTHHLSHTIFHTPSTPSFTHNFATHHLSHTTLSHTIFHTPLCHTPSFTHHLWHTIFVSTLSHTINTIFHTPSLTHHLSHTTLSHTIFHTPSFTHTFVTHHLWHTIFHTQLCHTPSFTTPSLSHTIFHADNFVTHHLSSTSSLVFPSFPVPATTFLAHYWKKLTCGAIRSFYLLYPGISRFYAHCPQLRTSKNCPQLRGSLQLASGL